MKNLKRISYLTCLMILFLLLFSEAVSKAQVKKMSVKDMTEVSTAVLFGKCTGKKCEWNDNRTAIYTYVTIVPEGYIKGNLGSEVIVAVPGGRVDDILVEVSETPIFIEDEEVVVFICKSPKGRNLITGGYQGKMKIEKDKSTGKRMVNGIGDDLDFEEEEQVSGKPKKPEKLDLEEFVEKVKGYAKN